VTAIASRRRGTIKLDKWSLLPHGTTRKKTQSHEKGNIKQLDAVLSSAHTLPLPSANPLYNMFSTYHSLFWLLKALFLRSLRNGFYVALVK
jgi:hypothetical protein